MNDSAIANGCVRMPLRESSRDSESRTPGSSSIRKTVPSRSLIRWPAPSRQFASDGNRLITSGEIACAEVYRVQSQVVRDRPHWMRLVAATQHDVTSARGFVGDPQRPTPRGREMRERTALSATWHADEQA